MANQGPPKREYGYLHPVGTIHTMSVPTDTKIVDFLPSADSHSRTVNLLLELGGMAEKALLEGDKDALASIEMRLAALVVELSQEEEPTND